MADFVKVARRGEVADGAGKVVEAGGRKIALFNSGGNFYAIDNTCVHQGGPLGEGDIMLNEIVCPWHLWSFEIETGVCVGNPEIRIATHDVRVEGDRILVRLT